MKDNLPVVAAILILAVVSVAWATVRGYYSDEETEFAVLTEFHGTLLELVVTGFVVTTLVTRRLRSDYKRLSDLALSRTTECTYSLQKALANKIQPESTFCCRFGRYWASTLCRADSTISQKNSIALNTLDLIETWETNSATEAPRDCWSDLKDIKQRLCRVVDLLSTLPGDSVMTDARFAVNELEIRLDRFISTLASETKTTDKPEFFPDLKKLGVSLSIQAVEVGCLVGKLADETVDYAEWQRRMKEKWMREDEEIQQLLTDCRKHFENRRNNSVAGVVGARREPE